MPLESERAVDLADGLTKLQLASLDACVRCHACLEWCPVFDILGDEQITPPQLPCSPSAARGWYGPAPCRSSSEPSPP